MRQPTAMDKTFYYGTHKDIIEELILTQTEKKGNIIYGSQAVRARMPSVYMTHKPNDWDIHSKNPKRDAEEMARKLNEYYRADMFYVLYKRRYNPQGKRIDVYSIKNRTITPAYRKDNIYVPAIRYSPIKEERKKLREYKDLTEIDYTPLDNDEGEYEKVPVYDKTKSRKLGTVKVRKLEKVYKHRKRMLEQKEYEFRRTKDESMLSDIERYWRHKQLKQDIKDKKLQKGKIPIITLSGKTKFIPKFIKFGGKE